jgi:arylsulfatase A-like enzyme
MPVTVLDAANTAFTKNAVHGRSLKPILGGDTSNWRDDLMAETFGHGYGSEVDVRMVVWDRWKFVHTMGDISELYNLEEDPYELKNLAQDPAARKYVKEGRERLLKWMTKTEDTLHDAFAGVLSSKQ